MADTDALVATWLLNKFRERFPSHHLSSCPTAVAKVREHGWDCGCYSEVTRDDDWFAMFSISCACGQLQETSWMPGNDLSLPQALVELMDLDRELFECPYDD